ncbi:energy transducer TonB [Pseudomonas solani]|uniref:energy transducer TonB n=1 Tax=Pseudomonas solani TaxID=2731552 RepID=UPI003F4ADB27
MSVMVMSDAPLSRLSLPSARTWRNAFAAGCALALHLGVLALLIAGWAPERPAEPAQRVLTTQLISLPAPAPEPVPAPVQPAVAEAAPVEPLPTPVEPVQPQVDPRIEQRKLEQAALARKRVEEQQRQEQVQQETRRREQQRLEAERVAAAAEQQRQLELARQAEQQRQAAERARQAEAAANSRQYLPIAKEAPDYPQRALDKGIQGDCTVEYRVNPQGRVEDPQVVGDCHPLFIRPSLAAAQTFRYQPRLENGQPVAVPGVRNTFHYRIER